MVPPSDHHALAQALIQLLTNEPLRERIRCEAQAARSGALSWEQAAQAQLESYRRALHGR